MAKLILTVKNQSLSVSYDIPQIVENSIDYLTYSLETSPDWAGYTPQVLFTHANRTVIGEENKVPKEVIKAPGFVVTVLGKITEDGVIKSQIPSSPVPVKVYPSGELKASDPSQEDLDWYDEVVKTIENFINSVDQEYNPKSEDPQSGLAVAEAISLFSNNKTSFLTPEQFGAKGDRTADDIEAIKKCLEEADKQKKAVIMAGSYNITSPIEITSIKGLYIVANEIYYTNRVKDEECPENNAAIKICGMNNVLSIKKISSDLDGISFIGGSSRSTTFNRITIGQIITKGNGIVFWRHKLGIYQNTVQFSIIRAYDSSSVLQGCYGISEQDHKSIIGSPFVTENNFYGGAILYYEWAVFRIKGNSKLYSIHTEYVDGGFYIDGDVTIIYPRCAEAQRDGKHPFYKIVTAAPVRILDATERLPSNEIDLSDVPDLESSAIEDRNETVHERFSVYDGSIGHPKIAQYSDNRYYYGVYSMRTYFWGKNKIFTPWMEYEKIIESTEQEIDLRLIDTNERFDGYEESEKDKVARRLSKLPTKFVLNSNSPDVVKIILHASYCPIGYSNFEVTQVGGKYFEIYDRKSNLVFKGNDFGDGTFRITSYTDGKKAFSSRGQLTTSLKAVQWKVEPVITLEEYNQIKQSLQ